MSWKKIAATSAVMLLALANLAACGPPEVKKPPDEVTVKLKWVHRAHFAGMHVAVEKGFYAEQNLEQTVGVDAGTTDSGTNIDEAFAMQSLRGIHGKTG